VEGETQARVGVEVRSWRFGDGELEELLALGRRPENGERRSAAGDPQVAAEAAFLARRSPTSGESEEGSLLGSGIYWARRAGRKAGRDGSQMSQGSGYY
jgi:hypothetical protein